MTLIMKAQMAQHRYPTGFLKICLDLLTVVELTLVAVVDFIWRGVEIVMYVVSRLVRLFWR